MLDCEPKTIVKGLEDLKGGECPRPYECTIARALLRRDEPELYSLLGEFPCGKQAELLYINGREALLQEGAE